LDLLRESKYYNLAEALKELRGTELHEEIIILFARLGLHEDALRVRNAVCSSAVVCWWIM